MNYFLVDYENIGFSWIKKDVGMQNHDVLVVFYSDHRKNLDLDELNTILDLKPIIQLQKIGTGTKNALDFQLTAYLGYLIGTHLRNSNFHIISNDKGFDVVCEYWRKEQYFVDRIGCEQSNTIKESSNGLEEKLEAYLGEDVKLIAQYIVKSKTKSELNNNLNKYYRDGKKVSKILKTITPILNNFGIK